MVRISARGYLASTWGMRNAGDTTVEDIGNSARVCDAEQIAPR